MLEKVQSYMIDNKMVEEGDRILIGVSGGADSICLFHVLLQFAPIFDLRLYVVHVNHGIRKMEAKEDEDYVRKICADYDIDFTLVTKDVPKLAKIYGLSEEEAGRKVRYEAFQKIGRMNYCNKIAVAHNKNDNAETVLFHLIRGTGIKGLTGIPPIRDHIIRPLLCVEREEIEQYMKVNHLSYRTDSTNLTEDYSRNKIRHRILAYVKREINNQVVDHISNTAAHLKEIENYLDDQIQEAFAKIVSYKEQEKEYCINLAEFSKMDIVIQKGIIRLIIKRLGKQLKNIDSHHINLVLGLTRKQVGKQLDLPYGILAIKDYESIRMKKKIKEQKDDKNIKGFTYEIKVPCNLYVPQFNKTISTRLKTYKKSMRIPKNRYTKWFDYDRINNIILLRTKQEGDFIHINSKGSRKKIKSLFIDDKIPREKRNNIPLLADGSHILWILGGRISEAYKVSEETITVLEISIHGGKTDGKGC
jgi:tRNA(Ile)-lysidine synthase